MDSTFMAGKYSIKNVWHSIFLWKKWSQFEFLLHLFLLHYHFMPDKCCLITIELSPFSMIQWHDILQHQYPWRYWDTSNNNKTSTTDCTTKMKSTKYTDTKYLLIQNEKDDRGEPLLNLSLVLNRRIHQPLWRGMRKIK